MNLEHPDITKMNLWGTLDGAPLTAIKRKTVRYVFREIPLLTKKEINGILNSNADTKRENKYGKS